MELISGNTTGVNGGLLGIVDTSALCLHFLVVEGDRHAPLFDVPVAAVALVFGMLLNSLVLGILLLRRCSEEKLPFLETLLGWLSFLDLVASCLVLTFDLMDHDFSQQIFKGILILWTGSSSALACAIIAADRLVVMACPQHYHTISHNCLIKTAVLSTLFAGGCLVPAISWYHPQQPGLLLAFCLTCLVTLSWSVGVVVCSLVVTYRRQQDMRRRMHLMTMSGVMSTSSTSPLRRISQLSPTGTDPPSSSQDAHHHHHQQQQQQQHQQQQPPAQCNAALDCLCTLLCWLPLLIHWLEGRANSDIGLDDVPVDGTPKRSNFCGVQAVYLRLIILPLLLRPLIFLVCCNETRTLWLWCFRRGSGRHNSTEDSYWESGLVGSPGQSRSLINDQESMLFGYRRTSTGKRSVCFQNVDEKGRSFLPDFLTATTKRTQHIHRKKTGRYWKRYSCSSCSEPMSLFTSSSTTSINHLHTALPLPNGNYKREMIARRSSAFKGSANITGGGSSGGGGGSSSGAGQANEMGTLNRHSQLPVYPHISAIKLADVSFHEQTRRSSF